MTHFLKRSALILLATTALAMTAMGATPAVAAKSRAPKAEAPPAAANGKIVAVKGDRAAYVVRKGDTLEKIADKLDTTIDELMATNKLRKTSVLQPGDVVKGPVVTKKAYVVTRGDTVFSIAKRFHVTVDQLREENDLSAKTPIRPGQQIRLPADYKAPAVEAQDEPAEAKTPDKGADAAPAKPSRKGKATPSAAPDETAAVADRAAAGKVVTAEAKGEVYKARKGDTLAKIADRVGTDINELKRLNHIRGAAVKAGQIYRGPSFTEHIYTAQAGETLTSIAQRFSVSVENLRAENELSKRVISVRQGQKVYLPDGYRDRTASPVPSAPHEDRSGRSEHYPTVQRDGSGLPARPQPYSGRGYVAPSVIPQDTTPAPTDVQVSQAGKGRFLWPLRGAILSDFGTKPGNQHNDGINIQAAAGDPVRAAADGEVIYAGNLIKDFGNLVLIKHPDGWATAYGNLARIDVKNQQKITQGQQIGQVGSTGDVTEPQLHFEVRYSGGGQEAARKAVDPKLVLPK